MQNDNQYFEGTLQLRKPNDEIYSFIITQVDKKENVFIAKQKQVKNGIDIYLSSQHFLQNLGKKLKKNFGGKMVVSRKLFSRNKLTSRDVYRVNVLYEPPPYRTGDYIAVRGRVCRVNAARKKLSVTDLGTGNKNSIDYENYEILKIQKTTVSKVFPHVEVIHPETFQSVKLENPRPLKQGEKVKIVIYKGIWITY